MGNANVKPHPKPRNKKQVRWKGAARPWPPGKPSQVQENGVPDIVHICWSQPEKDGGSPVTTYLVEHRRVGSPHWVKASPFPVLTTELSVSGLEAGWRYQFRVRAENAVGLSDPSEISEPFTVTLLRSTIASPKFTQELKDIVVLENEEAIFEVHFLGQPVPNVCWFKDGFEIFSSNRTRISTVADRSKLSILHSVAADEGEIKCTATNKAGHASTKAKFTIEAPPSIRLPKSYQDQDGIIFEIGETIRLNVSVSGRPTPLVFWSHDGESIQNDDRHELEYIDRTSTVKIENALRSDRGEYQIRAVNKLGQDMASFLVTITDKPTPPGKARVILTSGRSVTLSWSIPEDDGGCKIGNYIIEYYRVGWNVWLKAATSRQLSTMLGDLIEGSQYKFRVKAESPYGVSDPSEESETVFIADQKRGINNPLDMMKQIEHQPPLSSEVTRRRGDSSSPRVSFALNEDAPVRPERKKTGKTPEASPRMRRKFNPFPSSSGNNSSSIISENSFNIMRFQNSEVFDRKSTTPSTTETPKGSPTSPLTRQIAFNFPEVKPKQVSLKNFQRDKTKSPSPEIIITDTETINAEKSVEQSLSESPDRSPNRRNSSTSDSTSSGKSKSLSPSSGKFNELTKEDRTSSPTSVNRMRPPLTRQDFSGSSEFMLVLCPEGEQGAQFKKLGISFEENLLPPPLSLSAPELGIDPPQQPFLKRSSSSTELLNYRLLERLNDAALEEEERAEIKRNEEIGKQISLDIPTIQVNSKPTEQLVGLERKPSLSRRLSSGAVLKNQPKWSLRRQSLQDTYEKKNLFEAKLYKFRDTAENRREIMEYTQFPECVTSSGEERRESLTDEDAWMKNYVESIPSDEETESSADEKRNFNASSSLHYNDEEEEETYNPRSKIMSAVRTDDEKPFEILTVRKEPPDSSIVPKPILKKNKQNDEKHKMYLPPNNNNSSLIFPVPKKSRSHSLIESSEDPRVLPLNENKRDDQIYQRDRSNSIDGSYNGQIDTSQIKKSPNNIKRRSFSLIPSQANSMKDILRNKQKKNVSPVESTKVNPLMNVSALANFTSIAGAGLVIPEKMMGKKEAADEAKVVVDFYGDIVKSFGAKTKQISEFSRNVVSKYDTYEERKISETRPNIESISQNNFQTSGFSNISADRVNSPPRKFERQDTARDTYTAKNSLLNKPPVASTLPHKNFTDKKSTALSNYEGDFRNTSKGIQSFSGDTEKKSQKNETYTETNSSFETSIPSKFHIRSFSSESRNANKIEKNSSSENSLHGRELLQQKGYTDDRQSRSVLSNKRRKTSKSRDASTSPVRFQNWEDRSLRNSLESDFYDKGSLTSMSSRASSLTRRTPSPSRPKLKEITTQTSFRIEPVTHSDIIKKQKELATKAETRVKGIFEYFTDLAMVVVACWLYLFKNEYLAIPILLILVYRQLNEEMTKFKGVVKKRIPRWILKRFEQKVTDTK